MKQLIILTLCSLLFMGCTSRKNIQIQHNREFEIDLSKDIIELTEYARTHSSFNSSEIKLQDSNFIKYQLLPNTLKRKLDVKFYGDVTTLLKSLSDYCQFDLNIEGLNRSLPSNVYINRKSTKLVDILNEIGSQLPRNIIVKIDVGVIDEYFTVDLVFK